MAEAFTLHLLKIAMAQICQNLGWHAVQTSPMNILVDILHRYLFTFAQTTRQFCEHYNRTEPNLNDLGLAFKELGISLNELEEYVNNVEPVPFVHAVSQFPVHRSSQFHFPKEGCREVQHRPEWFHPHLPPAYPELEDDESVFSPSAISDNKACIDGLPSASTENGLSSPTSSPRPGMRRPLEVTQETNFSTPKRARLQSDEEGRPMREVISVTMTAAGIISPAREGRLPDTRTPLKGFDDSRPASPVVPEAPLSSPSPAPPPPPLPPPAPPLPPSEPPFEPEPPPPPLPPKEPVKKDENIAKISKIKNLQKVKEAKKVKIKKENKENKKKNVKDGKLKKKDILSKVGRSPGRPPKIKKDKVEKSVKIPSVAKSPKSPKSPKVPKPKVTKLKAAKTEEKLKSPPSSAKDSATKSSPKPAKKHSAKPPRSPKGPKVKGKSTKVEKSVPGGQLASLLAKASGVASIKAEKMGVDSSKVVPGRDRDFLVPKLELPDTPSVCDSPERLVIDDNPESISLQERDSRLAAVDECISAVIQRGLHDEHHTQNSNSSSNAKSDSEGLSTVPAKVKLEPRDVYDFTDDEEVPGINKRVEEPNITPVPKMDLPLITKPKKEEIVVTKEKHKEPRKSTRKEGERRGRKPKGWSPKAIKVEPKLNPDDIRPKTPEPVEDVSEMAHMPSFHGGSAFGMPMLSSIDLPSSLSHIPPALLPFSIPSYLPPVCAPLGGGSISPGPSSVHGSYMPYPKLVDLADVAISKARNEGDFDIGKPKEKEQREKDKGKRKEKREKKEKDKLKLKKKKEKAKDKGAEKLSTVKDKEKQPKAKKEKPPTTKVKEKKDKVDKSRAKEKKKDKAKAKEKKEKVEKKKKEKGVKKEKPEKLPKEEVVTDADLANSSIPRLTFKLGSGMVSDGTKIVIKGLSNVDSPSASPLPLMNEPSPPISPLLPVMSQRVPQPTQSASLSSGKSHPKPQSKVQPVPPAPARTVITETVGTIIDEAGNKIWICPACTRPDDGSPMIGCDDCDEWYHWVCVGIVVPPKEDENWFCTRCIAKKQSMQKKRKHRKEK